MSLNEPLKVMMYDDEHARMLDIIKGLHEDAYILEYGCGGSTMMFADHLGPKQHLISIEHNAEWYAKVTTAVEQHPNKERINLMLFSPDYPLDAYVFASPYEEMPAGLTRYLNPPVPWHRIDFALVDGVARGACLSLLAQRLNVNTKVALHDYTGREQWYDWALDKGYARVNLTNMLLELRVSR